MMPGHGGSGEGTPVDPCSFRSVSAREKRSCGASLEKRRSTSFDDTLGELANACASMRAEGNPSEAIKKKTSFWQSRLWKSTKGKKEAIGTQRPEEMLYVPYQEEKEENTVPRWKKLFRKLRTGVKDVRKPAICGSELDLQVANGKESGGQMKGEGKSKALSNQVEKQQRLYSVHPEPIMTSRAKTAALPIWERRNATQPSNLDLSDLRVTGLKHLQRPHQIRG